MDWLLIVAAVAASFYLSLALILGLRLLKLSRATKKARKAAEEALEELERKLKEVSDHLGNRPVAVACPLDEAFAEEVVGVLCKFDAAATVDRGTDEGEGVVSYTPDLGTYHLMILGAPSLLPEVAVRIVYPGPSRMGIMTKRCLANSFAVAGTLNGFIILDDGNSGSTALDEVSSETPSES